MISEERKLLLQNGLKQALIDKLNDEQVGNIVNFLASHAAAPNLYQLLIQIASMEVRGKVGAALLASDGVASTTQLKDLTPAQIQDVIEHHLYYEDVKLSQQVVQDMIINNQQAKLSLYRENTHLDTLYRKTDLNNRDR